MRGSIRPASAGYTDLTPLLGTAFERLLETRRLTLLEVYEQGHSRDNEYQLAEQLITWDERAILWRFHHLKVVERIIGGNVIGTQGTPVEVLGRRIDVRFFPDLWTGTRRDYAAIGARRRRPRPELTAITLRPRAAPPARCGSGR